MNGKMNVLIVEPGNIPREAEIADDLASLQKIVEGNIEVTYPYEDLVGLVCNEEGKVNGLPLNRALYDDGGNTLDIIAGNFIICGLSEDDFCSLTPELMEKYKEQFKCPETFVRIAGKILAVKEPVPDAPQSRINSEKPMKPHSPEI